MATSDSNPESATPPTSNSTEQLYGQILKEMVQIRKDHQDDKRREQAFGRKRFLILYMPIIFISVIYMAILAGGFISGGAEHVAVLRLSGEIGPNQLFSASKVNPMIANIGNNQNVKGLLLRINSPGGTPAQASMIRDAVDSFREKYPNKPVAVLAEDYLASGAYLVASGAERICVQSTTLAGSIGVIYSSWDLSKTLEMVNAAPRIITAGNSKSQLSPFLPADEDDVKRLQRFLESIHQDFIQYVKDGRGDRLTGDPDVMFSGEYFSGHEAVANGLADDICSAQELLEDFFPTKKTKVYETNPGLTDVFSRLGTRLTVLLEALPAPGTR